MKHLFFTSEKGMEPAYKTLGSSGLDLRAAEHYCIPPHSLTMIRTGVKVQIPYGCEGQLRSRSGFSTGNQCILINGVGTIDSDYRGEISAPMYNLMETPVYVTKGDRVAQLVITPIEIVDPVKVDSLEETERGAGGFGSTGVR